MRKNKSVIWTIVVGCLLLAAAVGLAGYNIWDGIRAEKKAESVLSELKVAVPSTKEAKDTADIKEEGASEDLPEYVLFPEKEMPTVKIEGQSYVGYIEIEKEGITLPVAAGEWTYEKLDNTPCVYSGSVYLDNMVIAGHNYTVHFGKLYNLVPDDEVSFTDVEGNVFRYKVGWTETVDPSEPEKLSEGEDWDLSLFTCNYAGDKRYTVRCQRITKAD